MPVLKPEDPIEAVALAPSTCRACPRFSGIVEGFHALRKIDAPVTEDDVADLAAIACGPCAKHLPSVTFVPESRTHAHTTVTRVWLKLSPVAGGSLTVLSLEEQEPSP
jgi:hypothetical protein